MKASTRQAFRRATAVVDRSARRRRVITRLLAAYYRARGANAVLVADAMDQAGELPIAATRSTLRWSAALMGKASMPHGYRPDRRLRTPTARSEALRIIDQQLQQADDPELRRQQTYLLGSEGPADPEVLDFVRAALAARLETVVAGPPPVDTPFVPSSALEILAMLDDALGGAGLRPFLMSGTLLGVVREGGLLTHDYDVDIGLLPGDGTVAEVADLLAGIPGITVTADDHLVWGRHSRGVDFDIFLHYEEGGRLYHATQAHAWWNTPFALVNRDVDGHTFLVPDDVDSYLNENYGDWRSPVAFFDKNFDTPNREFRQSNEALLYLYDKLLTAISSGSGNRFEVESLVRELNRNFGVDLTGHFGDSALLDGVADISQRRG